ncbi:MAG: glutamine-hydrolyzing GMP synthase, partial [Acidobacteriota bacterium]
MDHEKLLILDFGSQYTQLIARRVRENRVYSEIHPGTWSLDEIRAFGASGIVLSGGPESVYGENAPQVDPGVFSLGVPVLGICYGMQLAAQHLGGRVEPADHREYGRAEIEIISGDDGGGLLFDGLDAREIVWMSHGDRVAEPPPGFTVTASTDNAPIVAMEDRERRCFCIQFHPEVSHTVSGAEVLRNFLTACGFSHDWRMASFLDEAVETIRR